MKISNHKDGKCPICFCEYDKPVILGCVCNTLFCFNCITESLQHSNQKKNCPMCRGEIKDITLISDSEFKKEVVEEKIKDKNETLKDIILKNPSKKYLVFSSTYGSFSSFVNSNDDNINAEGVDGGVYSKLFKFHNIPAAIPKGSAASISKIINKFNKSEINILFLNTTHFGQGLNLEQADEVILFHKLSPDMEKQAIGRAQRPGRKTQLIVHKLVHENET